MSNIKLVDEITWGFNDGKPTMYVRYTEQVDPFPCYHHDMDLVTKTIKEVEDSFPIDPLRGPKWNVLAYDTLGHTNGYTTTDFDYTRKNAEGHYEWGIVIALMGKRTPLHPAMTRFVVAHEYGHAVEQVIQTAKYGKDNGDRPVLEEYGKVRGIEYDRSIPSGARNWHKSLGEIFADDYRLLIPKTELEHWPHPDIPRPEGLIDVEQWWAGAKELFSYKPVVNNSVESFKEWKNVTE
jgi:hypothetical protein